MDVYQICISCHIRISCIYAISVYAVCMPYLYILYVRYTCISCVQHIGRSSVYPVCLPYLYILHVCHICISCMYAISVYPGTVPLLEALYGSLLYGSLCGPPVEALWR